MRRNPSGGDPSEIQLLSASIRLPRESVERTVATLAEVYLRKARLAPESVSAREIGLLRRSPWPSLRGVAVVLWSWRRPAAFLRATQRFLDDEAEVRCAVLEGVANAAILEGVGPADPPLDAVLRAALDDSDARVRASALEAVSLIEND